MTTIIGTSEVWQAVPPVYNGGVGEWLLAAAGIFITLILPGAALLSWRRQPLDAPEWMAEAAGLSISLIALVSLLFFELRLEINRQSLIAMLAIAALTALLGIWRVQLGMRLPSGIRWHALLPAGAALAGAGLLISWRLYQARELAVPAWVDGVHHVLIASKILAGGGLPQALGPEVPVQFTYHFGFHTAAALFSAVSRMPPDGAVLWFGQALNAWVAFSVYRLAKAAWGDARIAVLAAVLTGLAFHMPAYYVTWSRYTLMAGLVLLGPAAARLLDAGQPGTQQGADFTTTGGLALAFLVGGLALTHYTALWLWLLFAMLWALVRLPSDLQDRGRSLAARLWRSPVLPAALAAVVGALLAGPWIERTLSALSSYVDVELVPPGSEQTSYWNYVQYLLGPRRNLVLLGLSAAGMLVALIGRRGRVLPLWGLLLALLSLPWGLRIGPFRPDHYAILLFFPASILLASLLAALADALGGAMAGRLRRPGATSALAGGLLVAAGLALGAWGGLETRSVVNPGTVLVRAEERDALAWIEARTPESARFFINTTHWQYGVYRGVDGGYWISTLTGRWSLLPPALYGHGTRSAWKATSAVAEHAAAVSSCDGAFWELVREQELSYIYLRRGAGALQPSALASCPGVREVYRHAGVHVYQIIGQGG